MKKIVISCMGSRERYGLPVALYKTGMLQKLYTDLYFPSWIAPLSSVTIIPNSVRAMLGRNHKELPYQKVVSQYTLGVNFRVRTRRLVSLQQKQELLTKYGSSFACNVAKQLSNPDVFVGFTAGALETFHTCKEKGIKTILDQVDPGLYEWELISKEVEKNPGWEFGSSDTRWSPDFEARVKSELELADEIIVNSQHSKDALSYWGISKNIHILPIASSIPRLNRININNEKPLRILFLGVLSLRKGIHIGVEAVHNLVQRGLKVELILAGESFIRPEKLNEFQGWKYIGSVPGCDVPSLIDSCDVLLFPTFSDGFGMVQVEAISRGMPVISTKNSAQVIEDGVSGFLVEVGSVNEVEYRIEQYCLDRDLLSTHSNNAFKRSALFSPEEYEKVIIKKFS